MRIYCVWASQVALVVKNLMPAIVGDTRDEGLLPGSGRSPGEGYGNTLQYSCLEKSHGQRSLVGYHPWGPRELGTTEHIAILRIITRLAVVPSCILKYM